ncbi:MAG: MCE family protein [Selenomonadaceae bacterium]|nr:MCE family protein [Selenomonadaceae bacterium]
MSAAAKVGAFTIGGIMMLSSAIFTLGNFNFNSEDDIVFFANFKQVLGLSPQADVKLNGISIGKVEDLIAAGGSVTVVMRVPSDTKIPSNSKVTITSVGIMGEKFVNIIPSTDNGKYVKSGDFIFGVEEVGMNTMFENLNNVMNKVQDLLGAVQNIIGDDNFQKSVSVMSENMKEATDKINGMTSVMERIAVNNEGNVNQMVGSMNGILESMNRSMETVEHMMQNIDKFAGDPQTAEDLKTTLKNISETSQSVADMTESMNKIVSDPQVSEDMKATLHNARSLTERADRMLGKVEGASDKISKVEVTPSVDVLYSGGASNFKTNFNVDITFDNTSFDIGAESIGDGTKLNAQVGKKFGTDFGARAGIIAGKPGIGVDAYAGDKWKFSAEVYDINDATLRLKTQYKVSDSTYILGEWHDINHRDERAAYLGIRQEF